MTNASKRAPMIQEGARCHYRNGSHYADRYRDRLEDVAYYLRLAKTRQRVLEYGAGTGRLTLPLGRMGCSVVAVDPAEGMLSVLEGQLALEGAAVRRRIRTHLGDMRTYRTRRRFDMVCLAFHTFCHLYSHEDVSGFLRLAFTHLEPGGLLAFDLPMPHVDMEGYDPIAQVRVTTIDGPQGDEILTQRLFQERELLMHLHYAGFRRCKVRADFGEGEVTPVTEILSVTARKPV